VDRLRKTLGLLGSARDGKDCVVSTLIFAATGSKTSHLLPCFFAFPAWQEPSRLSRGCVVQESTWQ
jgi:hypothetical protein